MTSAAIVWFRRDLRLHDHPALTAALQAHERLLPLFILDPALLHGRFASAPRTAFMLGCLAELDRDLRQRGSGLVVREGEPAVVLRDLARSANAGAVYWTSDVSPYARRRDRRVTEALQEAGVRPQPCGGNYIVDVGRPRTADGAPYRVFSPFHRNWRAQPRRDRLPTPDALPPLPPHLGPTPVKAEALGRDITLPDPVARPGEQAALQAVHRWLEAGLGDYATRHNDLSAPGTSQLSPYLRWGCLSPLALERAAVGHGGAGAEAWVRQLCWRDFYAHVLLMWPENARQEFQERFRGREWPGSAEHLRAWQRGETGFPAVDAGMRQLAATGWMHNRARLIVGSFLVKDLHVDWREGEQWFERLLLDGEPAQNNGNWQWIASVGVDPAPPYRRMYNPTRQGQRFDPGGAYVRRWVPELADVPDERLWEPWKMTEAQQQRAGCRLDLDYPAPIVDHQVQRRRALELYGAAR